MNRSLLILHIFVLICLVKVQSQNCYNPGVTSYRNQTWMNGLDYGILIRQLSMMGTHNSVGFQFYLGTGGFQQTQSSPLQIQLQSGIRAIDIRVKHKNNKFQVYDRSCDLGVNFDQILTTVKAFLTTYPTETVLLHLIEEQSSSGCTRSFQDTYKAYRDAYAPLFWTPTTQDPQLGEVRGMIVLLQDFTSAEIHGLLWATFTVLPHKKMGTNWDLHKHNARFLSFFHKGKAFSIITFLNTEFICFLLLIKFYKESKIFIVFDYIYSKILHSYCILIAKNIYIATLQILHPLLNKMQTVLPSDQHLKQKLFHKESQIISEHQKYPELFKWKTATIIMGAVTAVLLMVLLVVVYNIESEQEIVTNLTFLSAIAQSSRILTNKREILNFAHNFQQIYGTTKFQQAELLHRGSNFSTKIIKQNIYGKEDQNIIYLIELNVTQNQIQHSVRFATFMNSPFPVPDDEDFDTRLSYYSFEIKDQRKSSLLSLNSQDSLKLFSTNPDVKSVSECENYRFQPVNEQRQGAFMLLNGLIWFDFGSKDVKINTQGWKCFSPQFQTEKDMQKKLQTIFHPKINDKQTTIQLKQFQAYYLS